MADIDPSIVVLAEYQGQGWLVGGVAHIDDLLANTLPPNVSIEIVQCESDSEIYRLWEEYCGEPVPGTMPWAIHPGIMRRIRRVTEGDYIQFAPWSALLDNDALAVIRNFATMALNDAAAQVVLTFHIAADAPRGTADMAALRCGLIENELSAGGVALNRIRRIAGDPASVVAGSAENQRIGLALRKG